MKRPAPIPRPLANGNRPCTFHPPIGHGFATMARQTPGLHTV